MARYSRGRTYSPSMRPNRLKPILILLGVVLAAFLVIRAVGVGSLDESTYDNRRNTIIRREVQSAISNANSLSPLGGSTSYPLLARVRQYVHSVEILNEMNVSLNGTVGTLFPQSTFETIYSIIDEYEAKLSAGQKVQECKTQLSEALELLSQQTQSVLDKEQ